MVELLRQRREICLVLSERSAALLRESYQFPIEEFEHLIVDRADWDRVHGFLDAFGAARVFVNTIQGLELHQGVHSVRAQRTLPRDDPRLRDLAGPRSAARRGR
jgi:hypothetical protein